jgi:hypothetical protein
MTIGTTHTMMRNCTGRGIYQLKIPLVIRIFIVGAVCCKIKKTLGSLGSKDREAVSAGQLFLPAQCGTMGTWLSRVLVRMASARSSLALVGCSDQDTRLCVQLTVGELLEKIVGVSWRRVAQPCFQYEPCGQHPSQFEITVCNFRRPVALVDVVWLLVSVYYWWPPGKN